MTPRLTKPLIATALLAVALQATVCAQEIDVEAEIQALKEGQAEIRKELAEMKKALAARPTSRRGSNSVEGKVFSIGDNPVKGPSTAKLTLVEFTDYQ